MDPGILNALPWGTVGPAGLLSIVFMLVMLGFLIPKPHYSEVQKERDYWRAAHKESEAARVKAITQLGVLVGAVDKMSGQKELGVSLLESVKRASGTEEDEDPP